MDGGGQRCYRERMIFPYLKRSGAMGVALALFGCQLANPAFDPPDGGADGGTEDNGDTLQSTTTQSTTGDGDGDGDAGDGDAGDGDGDAGDGDGDGEGDGDAGDGDGDGDEGMEAPIEPDIGMTECIVETHSGLWPHFGEPSKFDGQQCPADVGMHVRVVSSDGGDWVVSPCPLGCNYFCEVNTQWRIGADGLQNGLAVLIPPMPFNQQLPWIGCYYVEATALVKQEFSGCYYGSLSAHTDEGPTSPLLFHANRESWGLTPGAAAQYGDWQPELEDQAEPSCACDQLEIECCPGHTVVAKQFVLGDAVPPGEVGQINLGNNAMPFTFYAAQAQGGTNCEIDPETSWALWAM
jgi:hypothetical protein